MEFDEDGHLTEFLESPMEYDPRGRFERVTLSNGDEVEMVYDDHRARVIKRKLGGGRWLTGNAFSRAFGERT